MKSIKKVFFLFSLVFFTLVFTGCQTLENIVVLNASVGNSLFMRNTVIKTKNSSIKEVEFDITVNAEKSTILKNPVVNYTITYSNSSYDKVNGTKFYLENDGNRYAVTNEDILYKEVDKKKNLNARFTSEIAIEDFDKIMSNYLPVSVIVTTLGGTELVLSSDEIDDKFNDLRIILK